MGITTNQLIISSLFAYFIASAESQLQSEWCQPESAQNCFGPTLSLTLSKSLLSDYKNITAMREMCSKINEANHCMQTFVERCGTYNEVRELNRILRAMKRSLNKFCSGEITQQEIDAYVCLDNYKGELYGSCTRQTRVKLNENKVVRSKSSRRRRACRIFADFRVCTERFLRSRCSSIESKILVNHVIDPFQSELAYDCNFSKGSTVMVSSFGIIVFLALLAFIN